MHLEETFSHFKYIPDSEVAPVKYFHHNDDASFIDTGPPADGKLISFLSGRFNGSIVHLKHVYVSFSCSCLTPSFDYIHLEREGRENLRETPDGKVKGEYENVIALGHSHVYIYGHWFLDVLAPLALISDDIIKKSKIILQRNFDGIVRETMLIFNKTMHDLIFMGRDQWLIAKNVYITNPPCHCQHIGRPWLNLHQRFYKFFRLDDIIPDKYYFINRQKGNMRYIHNFDELLNETRLLHPSITFLVGPDLIASIEETGKIYSSMKFLFCPTGSNVYKDVFMKPKSVIVSALGSANFIELSGSASCLGIYMLNFIVVGMYHLGDYRGVNVSIPVALKAIDLGIDCAINGKWKSDDAFYDCVNKSKCL